MNKGYVLYGLIVLVAVVTGLLALMIFLRGSLAKTHMVKLATAILAITAAGITFVEIFMRPLPEPFAQCETSNVFAPATITCFNRSENYSRIEWSFENGRVVGNGESIQRQVTTPGSYSVSLTAYGKWPKTDSTRTYRTTLVINPEPRREPERKTVVKSFSRSSTLGATSELTFGADPGFKIIDASLRITSASAAEARIDRRTDNEVYVKLTFQPKQTIEGWFAKMNRSWITGDLTMKLERLQ